MKISDAMVEALLSEEIDGWPIGVPRRAKDDYRARARRALTAALSASEDLTALREAVARYDAVPRGYDPEDEAHAAVIVARAVAT